MQSSSSVTGDSYFPPWRSQLVIYLFAIAFSLMLVRAYYLATNPANQLRAKLVVANAPQDALLRLVRQAERLSELSKNIENLSIAALKKEIDESIKIAEAAALEFDAQSRAWSELRGKIKQDSSTYDALRVQLADLQKLQRGEIARLSALLDEAKKPSVFADAVNLSLSFVLGVLSSLLASMVYDRLRSRKATAQ